MLKGENNPMYGKGYWLGKHRSEETKEKLRNSHKAIGKWSGENNPMYGKGYKIKGENNPRYNPNLTQEERNWEEIQMVMLNGEMKYLKEIIGLVNVVGQKEILMLIILIVIIGTKNIELILIMG